MIIAADIHFGRSTAHLVAALERACAADPQRLLVVAGDLTQRGLEEEYAGAEAMLRRVMARGIRVVCCPGNHDLSLLFGYAPSAGARRRDRYLTHITGLLGAQAEVLGFTRFDTVLATEDDLVISLRSAHRRGRLLLGNRVRKPQIRWARQVLEEHGIAPGSRRIHVVTHHSLWSLPGDRHRNMHRRERLERGLLLPFAAASFINGHNHRFEQARRPTPRTGHPLYHIQAPSLSRRVAPEQSGFVSWDTRSPGEARLVPVERPEEEAQPRRS